jgi:peroxiredoxin
MPKAKSSDPLHHACWRNRLGIKKNRLQVGAPVPWFEARSPQNPRFHFDTVAGRYVILCFFGSASIPASRQLLDEIRRRRDSFDDQSVSFFGVSIDPDDERCARVHEELPGIHLFWDFDRKVSRLFGVSGHSESAPTTESFMPLSVLLDERLRVVAVVPLRDQAERHVDHLMEALAALPALDPAPAARMPAPILSIPRLFEP